MILGESQQQFASPEEALQHYGVKGMRKGQGKPNRIDRKNGRLPKRLAILYGRRGKLEPVAVQIKAADYVNEKLGPVNAKRKDADFTDADWGDPSTWSPQTKEYYAEVTGLAVSGTRAAVKETTGVEPAAKHKAELNDTGDRIVVREDKVEHAVEDADTVAVFVITRNARGLVEKIEPVDQAELGAEFVGQLVQRRTV